MPLDTTVRHYTSSMNSATTLDNTANSFIRILDAVLVNGFGNVTLTSLTVSNNLATATVSSGYNVAVYCVVTISGATPSGLNGDKKVTSSGNVVNGNTTTFTFEANGISNQTATGTITCRFPGAGWTKEFSGTNVAVYKSSTGKFFRVDDNTTATRAGIRGYESMTSANTGVNAFPNELQFTTSLWLYKANSTGRKWWIAADSKTCYVGNEYFGSDAYVPHCAFGDFKSYLTNDVYNTFVLARSTDPGNADGNQAFLCNTNHTTNLWLQRKFNNIALPVSAIHRHFRSQSLSTGVSGNSSGLTYPNLSDGKLFVGPMYILESPGYTLRGEYRGLYMTPQNINSTTGFFFNDEAIQNFPVNGKVVLYKAVSYNQTYPGGFFIDISGPWD